MLTTKGLMKLMTLLSPSFPVGAYTYSHGVEFAVEQSLVTSGENLKTWIEGALLFGGGKSDGMIFCRAWALARDGDIEGLVDLNAFATTFRPTAELALESEAQGRAFMTTVLELTPQDQTKAFSAALKKSDQIASYPVAVGAVAAFEEIACHPALIAFLHAFVSNLVSAGVRLVPLGQTAGQQAVVGLEATIEAAAENIEQTDFRDIGSAAPVIDWTSMQHETQYTRLFRS